MSAQGTETSWKCVWPPTSLEYKSSNNTRYSSYHKYRTQRSRVRYGTIQQRVSAEKNRRNGLREALLLHRLEESRPELCRRLGDVNACRLERLDLVASSPFSARDNGAGMAHTPAGRRGHSGNER